jgi:hypothetical protein
MEYLLKILDVLVAMVEHRGKANTQSYRKQIVFNLRILNN